METFNILAIVHTDVALNTAFDKKDIKAQRIFLDSIKYHVIPHIAGKSHDFDIWKYLCTLYQTMNQKKNGS